MDEIAVSGERFRLVLRILNYEYPKATTGHDANWLSGEVAMTFDGGASFTAKRGVSLLTAELASFRDGVRSLVDELHGEATLFSIEGELGCTIKLERGRGEIEAFVREHYPGTELRAEHVPTDQSYLQETADQLDALLLTFPVRGNPYS